MDPQIKSFTSSLKFTVLIVTFPRRVERALWFLCGVCQIKKKKQTNVHNLKVENYDLSDGLSEDLSLGGRL